MEDFFILKKTRSGERVHLNIFGTIEKLFKIIV